MSGAWLIWLLTFAVSFALLESFALKTDKTTFSRFIWNASRSWPPLPFVIGCVVGGLAVHWWWPWCPVP